MDETTVIQSIIIKQSTELFRGIKQWITKGRPQTCLAIAHQGITFKCAGKADDLPRQENADAVHISIPELSGHLSKMLNLQATFQWKE